MRLISSPVLISQIDTSHIVVIFIYEHRNLQLLTYGVSERFASNSCISTRLIRSSALSFDEIGNVVDCINRRKGEDDVIVLPAYYLLVFCRNRTDCISFNRLFH